ncbi:DUF4846 domain-containing protein [Alkaliphilus serpentinus]|uniref:DUF4846 domain-containing protein n=1 Tax=Alkaliphilus serpentinus TaxID=1482731 RepID=A0A833HQD1_9FIRM|nr:DUF4846 domain-containing protein [Alkaliphilus serpentinus]KAB3531775.1 hypothetical protein F8153_03390 [Alkaliphilus serpentinus]
MKKLMLFIIVLALIVGCSSQKGNPEEGSEISNPFTPKPNFINEEGTTIEERFLLPEGFERLEVEEGSFAAYLRRLPLKAHGTKVSYYDGRTKNKSGVYIGVVDMDIDDRDLQQCADAIIRLRAEYFYERGEIDKIHFNFTNGFRADYSKWMEGYRVSASGNDVKWVKTAEASNNYDSFKKYLNIVFAYAGTISLENELMAVAVEDMKIGDVFIQGGSPGHAVVVVDMARNETTGEVIFLLAQSYMPAQETQILVNPMDEYLSPWYSLSFGETLRTPEWVFNRENLKRFE